MPSRRRAGSATLSAALLAGLVGFTPGCNGGGESALTAPSGLRAELPSFDVILLTWTPPAGADVLQLQGRLAPADWESLGDLPGNAEGAVLDLAPEAPEGADLGFRIRSVRGSATSPWSAEATLHRGVRPATGLVVSGYFGPPPGVSLSWTAGSTQADAIRVERRIVPYGATPGPWTPLPAVALGTTSVEDRDVAAWVDGADAEYRVLYVKGAETSAPAQGSTGLAPPLAPAGLTATPAGPLAIRLDWTARSRYATKQVVFRQRRLAPGEVEVATLPPEASRFDDTVPEQGAYVYRVSARAGDNLATNYVADSDPVTGFTTVPGLTLSTSTLVAPGGTVAVRDASGRFATAGVSLFTVSAWRQGSAGWEAHETVLASYPELAGPGLLLRPDGELELLYLTRLPIPPVFTREWFDGAWHGETVTGLQPSGAAVAPGGALHAVECQAGFLRHATNGTGTWAVETIPVTGVVERCAVTTGPAGDVRIAWTAPRPVPPGQGGSPTACDLHLVVSGPGGWTDETVPLGADGASLSARVLRLHALSAGGTVVIYQAPSATPTAIEVRAVTREAGTWSAPVPVGTRLFNGREESFTSAMSPDGSRVAVAWNGFTTDGCCSPATLSLRGADGSWSSTSLVDTEAWMASGFSPQGRLWVLELSPIPRLGGLLYEELP
jgi:hypothetical protein